MQEDTDERTYTPAEPTTVGLWRHRPFMLLWGGQTVSELGTRVSMFVFPLVTYAVTGSALLAGIAGGLDLLGMALALLPGGLLADRVHRGRLMRMRRCARTRRSASDAAGREAGHDVALEDHIHAFMG